MRVTKFYELIWICVYSSSLTNTFFRYEVETFQSYHSSGFSVQNVLLLNDRSLCSSMGGLSCTFLVIQLLCQLIFKSKGLSLLVIVGSPIFSQNLFCLALVLLSKQPAGEMILLEINIPRDN